MRKLTVAAMMIIAMLLLYETTIGGEEGIDRSAGRRAEQLHQEIGAIDP